MEIVKFMKNTEYFKYFNEESLFKIFKISHLEFHKKNSIIFTDNEKGQFIYMVKSGKVKMVKNSPTGKEFIIKVMGKGEIFAESLLFNTTNYPATAKSVEDAHLIAIPREDLEKLIMQDVQVASEFVHMMSQRLRFLSKKLENLTMGKSMRKVIFLLLDLSKNENIVKFESKRQDLASMIDISRENFERTLTTLVKLNLIEIRRNEVKIKDKVKLEELMYKE